MKLKKATHLLCLAAAVLALGACSAPLDTDALDLAEKYENNTQIIVDGGDRSGLRQPHAKVDIGYGDREYWAYTNEYGQLVMVRAAEIVLQNEDTEPVLSTGRYYADEAKVPGTESPVLDEGHVIADSLGGVSNAYNITPQDSTLNRHGDQAYMEKSIRDAGGCTDFIAVITYPDTDTQIPSHYSYTYTLKGRTVHDEFDNLNPDEVNASLGLTSSDSDQGACDPQSDLVVISNLKISRVDRRKEEVDIENIGSQAIQLEGYTLISVKGDQKYVFPAFTLEAGQTVTVYAKGGTGTLKWSDNNIWNNDSDPAELYDADKVLLDRVN